MRTESHGSQEFAAAGSLVDPTLLKTAGLLWSADNLALFLPKVETLILNL